MGKPTTYQHQNQVLDRTKALHGLRTQAYGETKYAKEKPNTQKHGLSTLLPVPQLGWIVRRSSFWDGTRAFIIELIGSCYPDSLLQIFSKRQIHGAHSFTKLYCPKDRHLKQVNKFLFLLKQRSSTAYNEKLESAYVKAHYTSKKEKIQES